MKKGILLLFIILTVLSCRSRKNTVENTSEKDSISSENASKPIDAGKNISDRLSFYENIYIHPMVEAVKITSRITAEDLRVSPLDATIYIETDKKIWSNINFLFFNAARAIITPEGIRAVDKYNKNYIDSDFEYLNNLLNINIINYKTLEKILLGRTFLTVSDRNSRITKNAGGYQLTSITNQKIVTHDQEREYKVNMQYSEDYDLINVNLQDVKSRDAVEIVYDNWESYENEVRLPKSVKIIIKGSKTSQILLENTKFDFSRMETPYSVPAHYKKIEIK